MERKRKRKMEESIKANIFSKGHRKQRSALRVDKKGSRRKTEVAKERARNCNVSYNILSVGGK